MSDAPTFSIVIPVFNRATLVVRAIESCLDQRHPGFEIVVVDDASTDDTVARVSAVADPRVRLVAQPVNRGVCPARNLGAVSARGEWVICLDSDDEFVPDALPAIEDEIRRAPQGVDGVRLMCRLDDGTLSPDPPLQGEIWDYAGYLRWLDVVWDRRQETMPCVRRRTFDVVRYPEGRGSLEVLYHADFAARFLTWASPFVARRYHAGAANQFSRPNVDRALAWAPDYVRVFGTLLDRHGPGLARHAPRVLREYTRGLATQQFLAGERWPAVKTLATLARQGRVPLNALAVLGCGVISPRLLAHAQAGRMRLRTGVS